MEVLAEAIEDLTEEYEHTGELPEVMSLDMIFSILLQRTDVWLTQISDFEIWAVQKYVHLLDLVKSFPTNIYLQNLASIQPRTSLSKFGENE